jgi:hypothetical protein
MAINLEFGLCFGMLEFMGLLAVPMTVFNSFKGSGSGQIKPPMPNRRQLVTAISKVAALTVALAALAAILWSITVWDGGPSDMVLAIVVLAVMEWSFFAVAVFEHWVLRLRRPSGVFGAAGVFLLASANLAMRFRLQLGTSLVLGGCLVIILGIVVFMIAVLCRNESRKQSC